VIHSAGRAGSTQKLTTGSYRLIVGGQTLEEGLFYADDLPRSEIQVLKDYVLRHNVHAAPGDDQRLRGASLSALTSPTTFRGWRLIPHRRADSMQEVSHSVYGRTKTVKVASVRMDLDRGFASSTSITSAPSSASLPETPQIRWTSFRRV